MNAQQLLDCIIVPTLKYMGGGYNSKNAQMLLLATAAAESRCGYYIKQVGGPALGIWQMEPDTHGDINMNCDALRSDLMKDKQSALYTDFNLIGKEFGIESGVVNLPMYACFMARLKYSMDRAPLPRYDDQLDIYDYYKRIYNTPLGASTLEKFERAWSKCGLDKVELR